MTDNDIIKALETCLSYEYISDCEKCQYFAVGCQDKLIEQALDLINRQKEEIERLKDYPYTTQIEVSKKLESQIKSEAITEFAERLKDIYKVHDGLHITINNLVKEMVGENK